MRTSPTENMNIKLTEQEIQVLTAKYKDLIPSNAPELEGRFKGTQEHCPHCGKPTPWQGFVIFGELHWFPFRTPCDCPEAVEEAKVQEEQRAKAEEERKAQERLARLERMRLQAGLNVRDARKTFDTSDKVRRHAAAVDAAQAYVARYLDKDKSGKPSMYIFGDIGTGKTHLATCMANAVIEGGRKLLYTTFNAYLLRLRSTYDNSVMLDESEEDIKEAYFNTPLLFLDDLGKEKATEWSVSQLFSLIDNRYNKGMHTVITSNYCIEELVYRLTPAGDDQVTARAICDRLIEDCEIINLAGESRRRM